MNIGYLKYAIVVAKAGSLSKAAEELSVAQPNLSRAIKELEKELDISSYSTNDKRVFGFVSERLLDAWLITNNIAYEELDVVYMESQHWLRKGMAFLNRKFFPHKEAHK